MKLSINGEIKELNFETLDQWVSAEFTGPAKNTKGIALAVNDKVIPKSKWGEYMLQNGDRILAVQATQGG